MEELNNEVLNDIKKEEQSNEQDYMNEMENFDLNCLFTFGINFDMSDVVKFQNVGDMIDSIMEKLCK